MSSDIHSHEGRKYLRRVKDAVTGESVWVDVYQVLTAFGVTCPARGQCVKKLLCCGTRGKGSELEDLTGALAALNRALELHRQELDDRALERMVLENLGGMVSPFPKEELLGPDEHQQVS